MSLFKNKNNLVNGLVKKVTIEKNYCTVHHNPFFIKMINI